MKFNWIILALLTLLPTLAGAQCRSNNGHHARQTSYHHKSDIVSLAANTDALSTLVVAVKAADLVSTLKSDGPFTVFAPTNTAFDKLPEGTIATLLKPENKAALQKVLTYHVVAGEFKARDIVTAIKSSGGSFTVKTVQGGNLTARMSGDSVLLEDESGNTVAVTKTDVDASNGVVHVIDGVVLPK